MRFLTVVFLFASACGGVDDVDVPYRAAHPFSVATSTTPDVEAVDCADCARYGDLAATCEARCADGGAGGT